jgi:hypothetical protein
LSGKKEEGSGGDGGPVQETMSTLLDDVTKKCLAVCKAIRADSLAEAFVKPVDVETFWDYLAVVDTPMDLEQIEKSLRSGTYFQVAEYFVLKDPY